MLIICKKKKAVGVGIICLNIITILNLHICEKTRFKIL